MSPTTSVAPPSKRRRARHVVAVLTLTLAATLRAATPTPNAKGQTPGAVSPTDLQFFEAKIRPLLADKCYKCHSKDADKVKGGLLLDTRE